MLYYFCCSELCLWRSRQPPIVMGCRRLAYRLRDLPSPLTDRKLSWPRTFWELKNKKQLRQRAAVIYAGMMKLVNMLDLGAVTTVELKSYPFVCDGGLL